MAFDYTTAANVFAYGQPQGSPSANEQTLMGALVTDVSRMLDNFCNQTFYQQTYTQQILRAQIDADGILLCWPAVPTMATPTAADWKLPTSNTWTPIDLGTSGNTEVYTSFSGSQVRFIGMPTTMRQYRGSRPLVRLSYTGGWASINAVPQDFEWAMRRVCWWEYRKRDAPIEKTANPQLGIVIIPGSWPSDIRDKFRPFVRQQPI